MTLSLYKVPNLFFALLTASFWLLTGPILGQERVDWRTEADLDKQLLSTFDLTWDQVPLRDGLTRLSRTHRVAIFLDRRVDPDQPIQMTFSNEQLGLGLQRIAATVGIGMSRVGDVIYLGPEETASRLPTVAELQAEFAKACGLPAALELLDRKPRSWERLSKPSEIVTSVAQQAGMKIPNLDAAIKNDLWPAADFPAMRTTDYLTLVLAGYHASYRLAKAGDGVEMILVPIPEELTLTRVYRFAGKHDEAIEKIRQLFPDAKVESDGKSQLAVTGSQQIQEQVAKLLKGGTARSTVVMPGKKQYTMKVEQLPLQLVVNSLRQQLGMEFEIPSGLEDQMKTRISYNVKEADLTALLDAVFGDTTLTYEIDGDKIVVSKKE